MFNCKMSGSRMRNETEKKKLIGLACKVNFNLKRSVGAISAIKIYAQLKCVRVIVNRMDYLLDSKSKAHKNPMQNHFINNRFVHAGDH